MHAEIVISIALAGLGLAGTARAQAPAGGLEIVGKSTVGDWKCREASIQPEPASPGGFSGQPPASEAMDGVMTLRFPVHDIDCGDALMNDHLRHALKADRHPTISFALTSDQIERAVQAGSTPVAVDGTLTIAGRTEPVRTEVTVTPAPGNALRVKGEQSLRMSAFGVKPPSLLLGALKVRDLVRVAFDIVVRRPVAGLLGSRPPALAGPRIR